MLGGGKMGEALVGGLLASGWSAGDLAVAEKADARREELAAAFPGLRVRAEAPEVVSGAEVVLLAVKPQDVDAALGSAEPAIDPGAVLLSIAAGVRIADLEAACPGRPVVRVMPNTPALVRTGASAIAPGSRARDEHLDLAEEILGAVGTVERVTEEMLDAVTGISGSGPAYVFYLAEAMIEAGRREGLPDEVVERLVGQTVLGAATLLLESEEGPDALRRAVTSPGGTTEQAVAVLEDRSVGRALAEAVAAAARRSRELGGG